MGNFFRLQRNLLNSDNSVQIKNREYHSLTALFRECSISRQCFQSDNRRNERGDKKQPPECGGLAEKDNADKHRPDGANARPDWIGGAQGSVFVAFAKSAILIAAKAKKPAIHAQCCQPPIFLACPRQKVKPTSHNPATIRIIQSIRRLQLYLVANLSKNHRNLLFSNKILHRLLARFGVAALNAQSLLDCGFGAGFFQVAKA